MAVALARCRCVPGADLLRRGSDLPARPDRLFVRFASPGIRSTSEVFDRKIKRLQKNRAASADNVHVYDYLRDHVAKSMVQRLRDVTRNFPVALDLGCGRGHIGKQLPKGVVETWVQCDMSDKMVSQSAAPGNGETVYRLAVDEEFLPFRENTFDLVVSSMSLHWVNDLPSTMRQIKTVLKADGVFVGCMIGGESLFQLRSALQVAETELKGGFDTHVSPFATSPDVASLVTGAGMSITTVDPDEVTIHYPGIREAMHDLRGMGENNAVAKRCTVPLSRKVLDRAEAIYKEYYGEEDAKRGTVLPLTFELIHVIGWKPSSSQPQPAERGSGSKDVLGQCGGGSPT